MKNFTLLIGKLARLFIYLLVGLFVGYFLYKVMLFFDIDKAANHEIKKINWSDEIVSEADSYKYGCDWDWKRGRVDCQTRYNRYFISKNDPLDEFARVNEYLNSLGWVCKHPMFGTKESYERSKDKGYNPSCVYEKENKYYLKLYLRLLGEKDRSNSDYYKKTNILLDRYSEDYPSIIEISVDVSLKG